MIREIIAIAKQQANPLTMRALEPVPWWNFFSTHRSRLKLLIIQKMFYWIFRIKNRLKILGRNYLELEMKNKKPFLVVANHSGTMDVAMHQAIHAHFNNLVFTFIDGSAFRYIYHPILSTIIHVAEQIPRFGTGERSVGRMVARLLHGDNVLLFPEGSFNFGLVTEGYTGVARVALDYEGVAGEKLRILPCCTIGMHEAYNPHRHRKRSAPPQFRIKRHNQQVMLKFGKPFTLCLPRDPSKNDLKDATKDVMKHIAAIWGQKKIYTNRSMLYMSRWRPMVGKDRVYDH